MRKGWLSRLGMAAFLGLSVAASGGGCAEEREPISQVQPNYMKKADLLGPDPANPTEWYMRMTITEVGKSNSFAFPGYQDELRRVRWDIQENFLVARRSYELVSGSDGKGADPSKNNGVIVAMFRIQSHFDIQRAYNPTTGEEQNVIVENPIDRPWFQRDYMRVDWSRNLVSDPDFAGLWFGEIFGEISWQNVDYYVTDPTSPNAPVYDTANGYFDLTSKWLAKAPSFDGVSWLPACIISNFYSGSVVTDCNDQEVAVRTSFMKVGQRDYEAMETDSAKFSMFGTFNRDRYGFSRQYGVTDAKWHRLVARHNLWTKSHDERACGEDGDKVKGDGVCGSVQGSVCDMYAGENTGKKSGLCTIPLAKREVRGIPYFVSTSMPADLWDTNQELIDQWNDAMVNAIAVSREVECRRFGGDAAGCRAQFFDGETPKASNGPALVLCHNPVKAGEHKSCGKEGTIAREGDLRYNLIGWVDQPLSAAPLGYGPDGADPLTGEVVQATAYIYGASLDSYATMARDLARIAIGDISVEEFSTGAHIAGGLGKYAPSDTPAMYEAYGKFLRGEGPAPRGLSATEIDSRMKGIQTKDLVAKIGAGAAVAGKANVDALAAVNAEIGAKGVGGQQGFGGKAEAEARMNATATKLAGSKSEAEILSQDQWLAGNLPIAQADAALAAEVRKSVSPFGGKLNPMAMAELSNKVHQTLEAHGMCMFGMDEFNAPHLEGLARKYKDKYKDLSPEERSQKLFFDLRRDIYRAVTEHEVGHTVGLRHNFQGSWDSMNFHPNYWKLRTADGAKTAECTGPRTDPKTDTCMGPRYLDPETSEEMGTGTKVHASIEEYAYSSIMDYGYDFNTDLMGLGSYDKAAMKFIYGGTVETFKAGSKVGPDLAGLHAFPGETMPRGHLSEQWWVKRTDAKVGGGAKFQPTHYTTLARKLQEEKLLFDASRCVPAKDKSSAEQYAAIDGVVCQPPAKDHAHFSEMVTGNVEGDLDALAWKTKDGRIRWPYRFGTDEYASYPHGLRFDAGADVYEAAENVARLYEYRYLLDFWRRGRRGWIPFFMGGRLWDRYFSRMHSIGWLAGSKIGQYAAMYPDKTTDTNPALQSDDWGRGYVLAGTALFAELSKAILRPQPGPYAPKDASAGVVNEMWEVPDSWPDFGKPSPGVTVSVLDGRFIDTDVSNFKGGSFNYNSYPNRSGTYLEKPLASKALAAQFPPMHVYYSRDTYVDGRNMLINFRSFMPVAYDRLMSGVFAFDLDAVAPYIDRSKATKAGDYVVEPQYQKLWENTYKAEAGANTVYLDPLVGFRTQVPTLLYTFWLGQDDGSMAIAHTMRTWIEGGPEALPLADSEKVFFYEPDSGVLWGARRDMNEATAPDQNGFKRAANVGQRMLEHANRILAAAYDVQTDGKGYPLYDAVTKRPKWTDPAKPATVKDVTAQTQLRRYVGILNVNRQYQWDLRGDLKGF